jgi:predicted DNA-binding transcriptional regulator YafY
VPEHRAEQGREVAAAAGPPASVVPALRGIFGEGIGRQIAERGRAESGGALILPLTFESEEVARARLLGLGPAVEVLSPAELRERMARQAAAVSALYGRAVPEAEPSTE